MATPRIKQDHSGDSGYGHRGILHSIRRDRHQRIPGHGAIAASLAFGLLANAVLRD